MHLPVHTVTCDFASPLGPMVLAAASGSVVGVWFEDQAHLPDMSHCHKEPQNPVLQQTCDQLGQYFARQRHSFDMPIHMDGTVFQQAVWQALLTISYGNTQDYGAISRCIGQPKACRAVGAALGCNPCAIIVPCHRVIGAHGRLTGYSGGLDRKAALLKLEAGLRM